MSSSDREKVLLDLIYDAAADPDIWPTAISELADQIGSIGGFIFGTERKLHSVPFTFNARLSEEGHRIYRERHFLNPWPTT